MKVESALLAEVERAAAETGAPILRAAERGRFRKILRQAAPAAAPGQPVITGLELLAGQAVDQFRLLTGCGLSFQEALSAATAELEARRRS